MRLHALKVCAMTYRSLPLHAALTLMGIVSDQQSQRQAQQEMDLATAFSSLSLAATAGLPTTSSSKTGSGAGGVGGSASAVAPLAVGPEAVAAALMQLLGEGAQAGCRGAAVALDAAQQSSDGVIRDVVFKV